MTFSTVILESAPIVCHSSNSKYIDYHFSEDLHMDDRWTIRRVSEDARTMVEEVHGMTGVPYGRLVSEAIRLWFDLLDQEELAISTARFRMRRTN